jgi:uncharacterized heparinase superfamily protein
LNEVGSLEEFGWDGPSKEKLWRYNQHYFDDLVAQGASERAEWHRQLIASWIHDNPPAVGTGWEPYPTSLRIVNWVKWLLNGGEAPDGMVHSLTVQTRWLRARLEYHLLGNHLFVNAKALIFAGMWFEGVEAQQWLECGFDILKREFDEQVLRDGGHFELSPMYHALALEDVLDLINLADTAQALLRPQNHDQVAQWRERVPKMIAWLKAMSHPDGRIAFFNDASFGIAAENDELFDYARRLGVRAFTRPNAIVHLEESGYVRLETQESVLIADMARIGPDYLPGHAHADTLSFEWSLFEHRVIVNSGTSLYGLGEERLRQRGTLAHSTVTVAGRNSSDVWSGFRVGARAFPSGARSSEEQDALIAECSHNGYESLRGRPMHHRRWVLRGRSLEIVDQVSPCEHAAEAVFHLHPTVHAEQRSSLEGRLTLKGGRCAFWRSSGGAVRVEQSTWHPEFGKSLRSTRLVLPLAEGRSVFRLTWC